MNEHSLGDLVRAYISPHQLGNPGLVEFYTPFLTALHERSEGKLAVLAQAHLGHSPTASQDNAYKDASDIGLTAQVQSAIEAVDAIRSSFEKSKVVVVGHSMGSWITLQVKLGLFTKSTLRC